MKAISAFKFGAIVVALCLLPFADPCCLTYGDYVVKMDSETAAIFWNSKTQTEYFVRSTTFSGKAKDVGFIFPSPTQPFRIEESNEELFANLEDAQPISHVSDTAVASAALGSINVAVLEHKKVGDYVVDVIRATNADALVDWLNANGHKYRATMKPWLDYYAKKNWVFCAFKYDLDAAKNGTSAVCIGFKTSAPHYPYKMPSDTWEKGHYRRLELWVVSDQGMYGIHTNGKPWATNPRWTSEKLKATDIAKIEKSFSYKKSAIVLGDELIVTKFLNSPRATNYDDDLIFVASNASPGRRLPIEGGVGACLVGIGLCFFYRVRTQLEFW